MTTLQEYMILWETRKKVKITIKDKNLELFVSAVCERLKETKEQLAEIKKGDDEAMRIIKRETEPLLCIDKLLELKEILLDKK